MKEEKAADPALIRRLRAAGCPMPEDCEDDPPPGLTIVVSRPEMTRAYVLRNWVEYVFAVRITNHCYAPLEAHKFKCRLPWRTKLIWPMDPRIQMRDKQAYRLPSGREFPCGRVLNHRTGRSGIIKPGDTLEGILLAFRKCGRIPNDCLAGSVMPAELSVVDQNGRKHLSKIEVRVDRTAIIDSLRLIRQPGQGLYGPSEPQTNLAVREYRLCEMQPPAFSSTEHWWNYDGDPAGLEQEAASVEVNAGKGRTGKGAMRT